MIIKLTFAEVKKFVSVALNINPVTFDLVIVTPDLPILTAFRQIVKEFPGCRTYDKIPAITKFRGLVPKDADGYSSVGLADAKWAVENAPEALANLERTGSIRG